MELTSFHHDYQAQTSQILLARPEVPHPDTPEFQPPAPSYDPYRTLRFAAFGVAIGPLVGQVRLARIRIPIPADRDRDREPEYG